MDQPSQDAFQSTAFAIPGRTGGLLGLDRLRQAVCSAEILDALPLKDVPRNRRLLKGVFETAERDIPLIDVRTPLDFRRPDGTDDAFGIILDLGCRTVALIVEFCSDA